jgi:hypothetical protein
MSGEHSTNVVKDEVKTDLINHEKWRKAGLKSIAKRNKTDPTIVSEVETWLDAIIDELKNLPLGSPLEEAMENHFKRGEEFVRRMTGSQESE